jgi:pSer/pThr/pTyr-binding forkhead associated (FHA) protein
MAKLILSLDGMVSREYQLTKERTTRGRKPHNAIVIDNLAISGEHAMIMTILNDSFLEDLGSTNGTLVNGQPIKKHFLQNNDVVELGKYKLKYVTGPPSRRPARLTLKRQWSCALLLAVPRASRASRRLPPPQPRASAIQWSIPR